MTEKAKRRVVMKRVVAFVLLVFTCLSIFGSGLFMTAYAADPSDPADPGDPTSSGESMNASFYKMASVASAWFSDKVATEGLPTDGSINSGNAGGLLGYSDEADSDGIISNWIQSALSMSSSTISYDAFEGRVALDSGAATSGYALNSYAAYARFGYTLKQMGFDETGADGVHMGRVIYGALLMAAYWSSSSCTLVFKAAVGILKALNPFSWFSIKIAGRYMWQGDTNSPFAAIGATLSNIFDSLEDISMWIMVPASLAGLVATSLLVRVADRGSKIKKFVLRLVIIVGCVPVCGWLYTGILNNLSDYLDSTNVGSDIVVQSLLVDFEGWAKDNFKSTGSIPIEYSRSTNGPSTATQYSLRQLALQVNGSSFTGTNFGATTTTGSVLEWNDYVRDQAMSGGSGTNYARVNKTSDLIQRYMSATFFQASDYETYVKGNFGTGLNGAGISSSAPILKSAVEDDISATSSVSEFGDKFSDVFSKQALTQPALWGASSDIGSGNTLQISYNGSPMSVMSVYNYLSTQFTDTGMVVYSNEKSTSNFTRESHFSVTMIGSGLTSFLYWLNTLSMLSCIGTIGWFYGFALIGANVKRSFKIISQIPFAALGTLQAGAKLITQTLMLAIEIIATILGYGLVAELLVGLTSLWDIFLVGNISYYTALPGALSVIGLTGTGLVTGSMGIIVMMALSSIFNIFMTVKALKIRKSIVKGLDEMMADIVNKFFTIQEHPQPEKQGLLSKAAGGLATGAGMAAMRGLTAGDSAGDKGDTVGNPDDVEGGVVSDGSQEAGAGADGKDGEAVGGVAAGDAASVAGDAKDAMSSAIPSADKASAEEAEGAAVLGADSLDEAPSGDGDAAEAGGDAEGGDSMSNTSVEDGDTTVNNTDGDTTVQDGDSVASGDGFGSGSGIIVAGDEADAPSGGSGGAGGAGSGSGGRSGTGRAVEGGPATGAEQPQPVGAKKKTKDLAGGERYGEQSAKDRKSATDGQKQPGAQKDGQKGAKPASDGDPAKAGSAKQGQQKGPAGAQSQGQKRTAAADPQGGRAGAKQSAAGGNGQAAPGGPAAAKQDGGPKPLAGSNSGPQGTPATKQAMAEAKSENQAKQAELRKLEQEKAERDVANARSQMTGKMLRTAAGVGVGAAVGTMVSGSGSGMLAGAALGGSIGANGVGGTAAMAMGMAGSLANGQLPHAKSVAGADAPSSGGVAQAAGYQEQPPRSSAMQGAGNMAGQVTDGATPQVRFAASIANGYMPSEVSGDAGGSSGGEAPGVRGPAVANDGPAAAMSGDMTPLEGGSTAGMVGPAAGSDTVYSFGGQEVTGRQVFGAKREMEAQMSMMKSEIDRYGDPTGEKAQNLSSFQNDYNAIMGHQAKMAGHEFVPYNAFVPSEVPQDGRSAVRAGGEGPKQQPVVAKGVPRGMPTMGIDGKVDWSTYDSSKFTRKQADESLAKQQVEMMKHSTASIQSRIDELRQELGKPAAPPSGGAGVQQGSRWAPRTSAPRPGMRSGRKLTQKPKPKEKFGDFDDIG